MTDKETLSQYKPPFRVNNKDQIVDANNDLFVTLSVWPFQIEKGIPSIVCAALNHYAESLKVTNKERCMRCNSNNCKSVLFDNGESVSEYTHCNLCHSEHFLRTTSKSIPPEGKKWVRWRFFTQAVDDYRPVVSIKSYPWWKAGESRGGASVIIVCWLPEEEGIRQYWPDAYSATQDYYDKIEFTDRFPQPDWYTPNN